MWGGRGGRGACACGGGGGGGGGGVILGEVKARPKDIISFSLDYISFREGMLVFGGVVFLRWFMTESPCNWVLFHPL